MPDDRTPAGEEAQNVMQQDAVQLQGEAVRAAGGDGSEGRTPAVGADSSVERAESADPGSTELPEPDARLLAAHDLAMSALHEITAPETVGDPAGHTVEPDGVVSLRFANALLGYPGWFWTVSVAVVGGEDPTVLEAELLPGEDALLAPEWVPWSVRLKEYQEQQRAAVAEAKATADTEDAETEEDETAFDEFDVVESDLEPDDEGDDFSEDGSSYLHAGDVDGVDIDELDARVDDSDDDRSDEADEQGDDAARDGGDASMEESTAASQDDAAPAGDVVTVSDAAEDADEQPDD